MNHYIDYKNSEENEIYFNLYIIIDKFKEGNQQNIYEELTKNIAILKKHYKMKKQTDEVSVTDNLIHLLDEIVKGLLKTSFMNQKFLSCFIYQSILYSYDVMHQENPNTLTLNNSSANFCSNENSPTIIHCLNLIVKKFIFGANLTQYQDFLFQQPLPEYLSKFFQDNSESNREINQIQNKGAEIQNKTAEILFVQLISLHDYKNSKDILTNLNDEKVAKDLIESSINYYYKINDILNVNKKNNDDNKYDRPKYSFASLFQNDYNISKIHLLRYLKTAIINVFTPTDPSILNYFQTIVYNYFMKKSSGKNYNKSQSDIKLDLLGKLFLDNNIINAEVKIRNICFLIDIIMQRYFKIQNIPNIDLLKFPRINIVINRLFIEKINFHEGDNKEIINGIFEHFIISQFIRNYMKYEVKDPEHYPLEIRYFIFYSYIKLAEELVINNPFSAYITSIGLREIISYLHLEKGFHRQKYFKKNNNNNNKNNLGIIPSNEYIKNSTKKTRTSENNKQKKKESIQKRDDLHKNTKDESIYKSYIILKNAPNFENKKSNEKIIFGDENNVIDDPPKLISKTLFNYLCFIFSMKTKYSECYSYFEDLYSFIDNYISKYIKNCNLDKEWTWLLIYPIKCVKNFNLEKTYEKFKIKIKTTTKENLGLIAYLSKKIKYSNIQEHFLILYVIYTVLSNTDNLNNLLKSPQFSEKFKSLKRALSYLSFNINYSENFNKNMPLINQNYVSQELFKVSNLLSIENIDEYFWIPKNLKGYNTFQAFISILDDQFKKVLYKQSLYSEFIIFAAIQVKIYINKFSLSKVKSKIDKIKEQYLLVLNYFCNFTFPNVNSINDLKSLSILKEYIINLIELQPDLFDMKDFPSENTNLMHSILLSGEHDLIIYLFLIIQIITNSILEENSKVLKILNDSFKLLINKKYKFMINFFITIYKSIDKYLNDMIDNYVQINFPENNNFSKKDYQEYTDFFKIIKNIDHHNIEGAKIQVLNYNWNLIKKNLVETGVFYDFLKMALQLNYPKSVINLIEKQIYDFMRKKNIHNFSLYNDNLNSDEKKRFISYLKLYYKAYSLIDENKMVLDNYLSNNQILLLINNNYGQLNNNIKNNRDINLSIDNNVFSLKNIINNINDYLIGLKIDKLLDNLLFAEQKDAFNNNNIYLTISCLLYNIVSLNTQNNELIDRQYFLEKLKDIKKNEILKVLNGQIIMKDYSNSINYSLFIYEFTLYLEQFEKILFDKNKNTNNTNKIFCQKLKEILINKRKIPHLKRNLLVFEFRRFIFKLHNDHISELYCLMDICKVFKSIWETGIFPEEVSSFKQFINIYLSNLYDIKDNLLLNIDKKLFLVPLKYYVKYFAIEQNPYFYLVIQKYKRLFIANNDLMTNKVLILLEKLKSKTDEAGLNDILLAKINNFLKDRSAYNNEGYLLYTDFYLDRLVSDGKIFNKFKPNKNINYIKIYDVNQEIYNYLEGAINICIISNKEKYLRKYLPEIINLFFKINFAVANYIQDKNSNNNISKTQADSSANDKINIFFFLLNKFKNEISINKLKIVIPQLIICYQYNNTLLYDFAIELLVCYAEANIDLIAYLFSSFLNFKIDYLENIEMKPNRGGNLNNYKYMNYLITFNRSKLFTSTIKSKLSENNKNILIIN